ncbi:MAG: ATP-binding protein [Candidatus Pacearchaeota archaeon]|jgi:hypothetical protein
MIKDKQEKSSTIRNYLLLIIKLILILSIINGIYFGLWQLVSINSLLLILTFIPQFLKKSYKIIIPQEFEWILLIFVILSLFIGKIQGIIVPLIFGIIMNLIGFLILLMLYSTGQIKKNYFLIITFAFSFAIVLGFGLEFLKYYLKLILHQEINLGIYTFMMKNMTYIIIGAAFSSIIGYAYMKTKNYWISKLVEKFKKSNPKTFKEQDNSKEILELIKEGEKQNLEFKSTLRINLHTNEIDRNIEQSVMKTINAFLNSEGGILLIGVSNNGEIIGIENDKFENIDRFNLHLINLIKQQIGKKSLDLINIDNIKINNKTVTKIEISKSKKEIFLKINPKEEEFYIRIGPSTVQLKASELVDYIQKKFRKKD